ncbi:hypothetical protein FEM48_Zijuj05G0166400 [Ziziphus jujuba var. spinosa]|uniref:Leucine-rich repeat-containing N-terminal plant-type domain-containing protein n=1 Tax=Ziziphus jujuba var. spinosa TaxID=714518 RepID=A0A978VFX9_ZIZJJ|nr:hypothetical protein FEM48_Zijuj05G0166400 [Ziziphus jujuba var. spinosa]
MGLSLLFFSLFMKLLLSEIVAANSFTSFHPSCHDDERTALLQFKESLVISKSTSTYEFSYPKIGGCIFEREAMLQFKDNFVINKSDSICEICHPKFLQWKSQAVNTSNTLNV